MIMTVSSQKSEREVEGAASYSKQNERGYEYTPHLAVRLDASYMRGINAQYEKKKLRYAHGKRAANRRGTKAPKKEIQQR